MIMTEKDKQEVSDLIKQAKEGKQIAFSKLYERYKKNIYITIIKIVKNKDVADDLLSITFVKAFTKLDSFVDNISFELWLKTIAINSSIDYIRHTKKESNLYWIDDDENCKIQLGSTADYSPEEDYIFKETDSKLSKACVIGFTFSIFGILLIISIVLSIISNSSKTILFSSSVRPINNLSA